ncbi:MAG: DUF5702 domain-containing protein [Candidatus Weimeria sp.]
MKRKGSITVFLSLSLASVLLLFFLLLDLSRIYGQKQKADLISDIAAQSVFADYNRYLWDNYRILGVDASYGTGGGVDFSLMESRMQEYLLKNGMSTDTKGREFFQLATEQCEVTRYGFITDDNGRSFLKQAAAQQKLEVAQAALEEALERNKETEEASDESGDVGELIDKGGEAMTESESMEVEEIPEGMEKPDKDEVNPIDQIREWKDNGILAQVLPSSAKISDKKMDLSEAVSKRTLSRGNCAAAEKTDVVEKALFAEYEKTHFSNYRNDLGHDGLSYEWEYVICGGDTDRSNLSGVVTRLLGMREASNFVSLMSDEAKVAQADTHALTLAGWTGNAAIVNAVFFGLIASWAYMESVLDVRLLLSGGKVSVMKSPAEWTTTDLLTLPRWFDVNKKAKEAANGISYEGFLLTMSALQTEKTLGLRSLDLLENSARLQGDYSNLRMDQIVVSAEFSYKYSSRPAFFSLFALSDRNFPTLKLSRTREMTFTGS